MDDDIDQRKWLRTLKSYGPDWDAAIEFGIDVSLIENSLSKTHEERLQESVNWTQFAEQLDVVSETLYGPKK